MTRAAKVPPGSNETRNQGALLRGGHAMNSMRWLQGWRQGEVLLVLLLGVASVLLWRVPMVGLLWYPFQLLGTFIHEICHGLAAIMSGGDFQRFVVHPDQSGTAWYAGGVGWFVTSAGYVGCAVVGGGLTILSARDVAARSVLFFLGVALGILCLIFVKNLFGMVTGLILAGALMLAGDRLPERWADGLLLFLAVQVMLNAINSLFDLVYLSTQRADIITDAQLMQQMTGIPAPLWALAWSLIALAILAVSLTIAYRRTPAPLLQAARRS
jgi:hypothetical protein